MKKFTKIVKKFTNNLWKISQLLSIFKLFYDVSAYKFSICVILKALAKCEPCIFLGLKKIARHFVKKFTNLVKFFTNHTNTKLVSVFITKKFSICATFCEFSHKLCEILHNPCEKIHKSKKPKKLQKTYERPLI